MRIIVAAALMVLAACSATQAAVLTEQETIEFREDAEAHIWRQENWCPVTKVPELLELYDPVNQRSERFLDDISGTELEAQYAQAKVEWDEEWGDVMVECVDPVGVEGRAKVEADVAEYEALMTRLEGFVQDVKSRSKG